MNNLYLDNGYVNIPFILSQGTPFNFVWGGRGTGKTYGALSEIVESGAKFMLMRRTQNQLDIINKPEFSPFKSLNRDKGWNIDIKPLSKYNGGIYKHGEEAGDGLPIGYTCALSTISNIRGFDASDIDILLYDEFIPEKHARPIKEEAQAFLNAYETINRNRELQGRKPLIALCLANANTLDNPLFLGLGLVCKAEKMYSNNQEISIDKKRGVSLFNLCRSEISDKKRNTALYKFAGDGEFSNMALSNDFSGESERGRITSRAIKEYKPIVAVGELCIYAHKSRDLYYVSSHFSGNPLSFGIGSAEKLRFCRMYNWIWLAYLNNKIEFETRICEILLQKYFSC